MPQVRNSATMDMEIGVVRQMVKVAWRGMVKVICVEVEKVPLPDRRAEELLEKDVVEQCVDLRSEERMDYTQAG